MNRESVCREILQNINLWHQAPIRALPWVPHGGHHPIRCREDVRPIFWAARPKSYIYRTKDWDEFPNGRLGNISSPAFGDLKEYYLFYLKGQATKDDQLKMYGHELQSIEDVQKVFINFLTQKENENGVKVTKLPWNEQESTQDETQLINDQLVWCNSNGILTINSQPAVNGAPSTDPLVGWGQPGGYCYQKAYLEFFTSRENAEALHKLLPDYKRVSYHIINHDGSIDWTNSATNPIAVTWGVFPGQEIAQPTVVDPLSFRVWKDEAYDAWLSHWAHLYAEQSSSRAILQQIHDEWCLVTLVDNDFPQPVILYDILEKMLQEVAQNKNLKERPQS